MSRIDLHIHTSFSSDADFSPQEIIEKAKEKEMKIISIADHNSTQAYQAIKEVPSWLTIFTGIELDCTLEDVNLHVLGYGIDPKDSIFEEIRMGIENQEKDAGSIRMDLVEQLGIFVDREKVFSAATHVEIPGELIAEIALADERNRDNELLKPYRVGGSRSDNPYVNFYWDFCAKGKPAYVPIEFISLQEAVEVIRRTGGFAVLAHPGNNIHENEELLKQILDAGVVGIEVYSSYHSKEQIEFYHQCANKYHCLMTCGSDFHGKNKPSIEIGGIHPHESFEELKESFMNVYSSVKEGR